MNNINPLNTERLYLSLIVESDKNAVFETLNNENTANIISFLTWPMTLEQAGNWCQRSIKGLQTKKEFLYIAREKESNVPIGCISLLLSKDLRVGEIGYWVSQHHQGKGFATEMLRRIVDLAFNTLMIPKLVATAAVENPTSLKVLQKQGFKIVGCKNLPTAKRTLLSCHLLELTNFHNNS